MSTPAANDPTADLLPMGMGIGVMAISWAMAMATQGLAIEPASVFAIHASTPSIWLVDLFPILLVWARRQQYAQWSLARKVRHLKRDLDRETTRAKQTLVDRDVGATALLNTLPDAMLRVDKTGQILEANAAAGVVLGMEPDLLVGVAVQTFLPHLDTQDLGARHTRRTSRDELIATEWHTTALHSSGQRFPAIITTAALGEHTLYTLRDDGPHLAALAESQRDLERRLGSMGTAAPLSSAASVAHMNHSLRTPLAAILGYAELLGERTREDQLDELSADVARIEYAGRELLNVLDNLTDLSLELSGQLALTAETVRLATLVEHAVLATRPLAQQRNNQVEVASNLARLTVLADPQRTRRVLINLLSRAHSATQNGHLRISAQRTSVDGQPQVAIEIDDDGTPMTPEEVLRHLDQSTGEGARLGLWLCRRLARRMGGELDIQRSEHGNTAVLLTLPTPINPTLIPGNALHWAPDAERQNAKRRGLFLGLDRDALAAARGALPESEWAIETCTDLDRAPGILRAMKPDLVLVGEQDAMATWRLLDQIRRDPVLSQSPVVLVSAHPDPRRAWRARLPVSPPEVGVLRALCSRILERGEAPRVVVAEANASTAADLAIALRLDGCAVTITHDTDDALDLAVTRVPDLMVLGPNPGRGPSLSQVLAAMRAEPATRNLPLMVSPRSLLSADDAARLQQFRHVLLQPSDLRDGDRVRKLAQSAMRPGAEA